MKKIHIDIEAKEWPVDKRYLVSRDGQVISTVCVEPKLLSQWYTVDGYLRTKVNNRNKSIHRLVAETYLPNDNNALQVNHKDGNKENNHVDNLEWVTQSENLHHAMMSGLHIAPPTPIIGTHKETGETIYFESQASVKDRGFIQPNINKCLRGIRKSAHGYTWRYAS